MHENNKDKTTFIVLDIQYIFDFLILSLFRAALFCFVCSKIFVGKFPC